MDKLAHSAMKYTPAVFICIFFVLCAAAATHIIKVDLPSNTFVWMANLSTDILVDQPSIHSCSVDASDDSSENLDDVIINIGDTDFFLWSGVAKNSSMVCPHIVGQPLKKIPIAWYIAAHF